jgi:hypothetical protein
MSPGGGLAALGVGDLLLDLLKLRHQLGQEGRGVMRVLDQLGHVVNDDGSLMLDGGGALTEATDEQRHNDGQGASLDLLDEGGGCQLVNALGGLSLRITGIEGG